MLMPLREKESHMIPHKPHHKGFKRKSFEEMNTARSKFQNQKSNHQKDKDRWNREWKKENASMKFCWSCGTQGEPGNPITQMHALKQRFISTEEDCKRAAWVCWKEHIAHDEAQGSDVHRKMAEFVDHLIERQRSGLLT
jgi:membrane protease subunit (stomatin/prohibitin family)